LQILEEAAQKPKDKNRAKSLSQLILETPWSSCFQDCSEGWSEIFYKKQNRFK